MISQESWFYQSWSYRNQNLTMKKWIDSKSITIKEIIFRFVSSVH